MLRWSVGEAVEIKEGIPRHHHHTLVNVVIIVDVVIIVLIDGGVVKVIFQELSY